MRLLAPAALAVFAIVFLIVVIASLGGDGDSSSSGASGGHGASASATRRTGAQRREPRTATRDNSNRRFYIVRAGDNLALIAERTGVSLEDLRALNPTLDPQALVTGQRVRLRARAPRGHGRDRRAGDRRSQGGAGVTVPQRPLRARIVCTALAVLLAALAAPPAPAMREGPAARSTQPAAVVVDARDGRCSTAARAASSARSRRRRS